MKSVEKLSEEKGMTKNKELCVGETLTKLLNEKKITANDLRKFIDRIEKGEVHG